MRNGDGQQRNKKAIQHFRNAENHEHTEKNKRETTRNAFEKGIQTSKEGGRSCVNAHPLPSRNARVGEPTSLLSCLPWHVPPHAMALPSLSTDPPEGEQHRGDQDEQNRSVKIVRHRQPSFAPPRGSRSPFPVAIFLAKGGRESQEQPRCGTTQTWGESSYPCLTVPSCVMGLRAGQGKRAVPDAGQSFLLPNV